MQQEDKLTERAKRYAHSVVGYSKRVGASTGDWDRMLVSDAFVEGYNAALADSREHAVHKLDCHEACHAGVHHKNCPWQKANDNLLRARF